MDLWMEAIISKVRRVVPSFSKINLFGILRKVANRPKLQFYSTVTCFVCRPKAESTEFPVFGKHTSLFYTVRSNSVGLTREAAMTGTIIAGRISRNAPPAMIADDANPGTRSIRDSA